MITSKHFDEIIKDNIITVEGSAAFRNDRYACYYTDNAFSAFVEEMRNDYPHIYERYNNGKGKELDPHRQGITPPKMASVASSSRFCYLALRNLPKLTNQCVSVDFEFPCPITGINRRNPPQLDAYIPEKNIFIEVKCHEIFTPHKIKMSNAYKQLVIGEDSWFKIRTSIPIINDEFEIPFTDFGFCQEKTHSMFDIKQFLCHLMGIKSLNTNTKPASLVYLFFKPKTDCDQTRKQIDDAFDSLQSEIIKIFQSKPIKQFVESNNISLYAIAEHSKVMEPLNKNFIVLATSKRNAME